MNKPILLSAFMTCCLFISSIALIFSPPATFFEVQRDRKTFSLNPDESFVVINNYAFNINRIVINLTKGTDFTIHYQTVSDTPTDIVNQSYQTNHLSVNYSTLKFFSINSTSQAIQGFVEVDYGILT